MQIKFSDRHFPSARGPRLPRSSRRHRAQWPTQPDHDHPGRDRRRKGRTHPRRPLPLPGVPGVGRAANPISTRSIPLESGQFTRAACSSWRHVSIEACRQRRSYRCADQERRRQGHGRSGFEERPSLSSVRLHRQEPRGTGHRRRLRSVGECTLFSSHDKPLLIML